MTTTTFSITQNGRSAIFESSNGTFSVICGFVDSVTSEFRPSHSVKPRTFKTDRGAKQFGLRFINREVSLLKTRFAPERI